ncbi:flagellar hook-associated protein FlgK [Candidatus Latescibacterota bacterium]
MPVSAPSQGIEIGRRALQAHQTALNVTSHNIANASTEGYSRQRVELESVAGGVGSGVDAAAIVRQRSSFLDSQVRVEQQILGRWEAIEQAMTGLEGIFNEPVGAGSSETGTIFNEPSGTGLSGSLSRFWNAWQDLANVPESGAARASVRQEADFLVTTMHQLSQQLADSRSGLDAEVVREVEAINQILDQLADINGEIPRATYNGGTDADLSDQRDRLIEELSTKVDISVIEGDNGQVSVLLSGHNLVQATTSVHLAVRILNQNDFPTTNVFFADDGSPVDIAEGRLSGQMMVRDETIPGIQAHLDDMAAALVEQVNGQHRSGTGLNGTTDVDFFDNSKTSASNMAIDAQILGDLDKIAASGDGNAGDNEIALSISQLRNRSVLGGGGSQTIEGYYQTLLGEVGAQSKEAQTMAENHRLFASQIENRRQGIQGVSLNDEASQLILFQRAYQAAARTVSVIDELMEMTIGM